MSHLVFDYWEKYLEQSYPEFVKDKHSFPKLSYEQFFYLIFSFRSLRTISHIVDMNIYKDDNTSDSEKSLFKDRNNIDWKKFDYKYTRYSYGTNRGKFILVDSVSSYLYENWNKLNHEVLFSEAFLSKLLLHGNNNSKCKVTHALIYFELIRTVLLKFQNIHMFIQQNDIDFDYTGDNWNCEEFNFILQHNDRKTQTTGLFSFINESMLD